MHAGVGLACVGAELTREDARVELGVDEFVWRLSQPSDQARCRGANVRTIQVGANTPPKHANITGFAQARISAGRANLLTKSERVERLGIGFQVLQVSSGVTPQHGF